MCTAGGDAKLSLDFLSPRMTFSVNARENMTGHMTVDISFLIKKVLFLTQRMLLFNY